MKGSSVNPATETFGQARQGSVAAIIQVLNERLSDVGIRTRAVVADGMLQLLCEADTADKLEQASTVERVRSELERISPQRIKRVKINSRIVREEQLLWLEEINRDPENALLWSEIITLKRPFFVKRWLRDRNLKPGGPVFKDLTADEPAQSSLPSKVIGGLGLVALLLGAGWLFREDLNGIISANNAVNDAESAQSTALADGAEPFQETQAPETAPEQPAADPVEGDRTADTTPPAAPTSTDPSPAGSQPATPPDNAPSTNAPPPNATDSSDNDPSEAFAEAVRVANQAAADGQTASTAAEWLDLAARWQRASDLMKTIPASSEQYAVAKDRITTYQQNSQAALQEATSLQAP
ncbi:MAG: hypothetical protein AAF703_10690 [Cyanobacteria bacterium P01_D01_bin.105]